MIALRHRLADVEGRYPLGLTAVVVALLCAAASGFSLVTVERVKYARLAAREMPLGRLLAEVVTAADIALVVVTALLGLAVAALEWRRRGVSRLLAAEGGWPTTLFLAALLLWFGHAVLAPGVIATGDAGTHVARVAHLAMALGDGASLFWDNYFSGGGTLLQFTGPVFHWLAAAATLVVGDATVAIKLISFTARAVALYYMIRLLRELGCGPAAARLGGLFYACGFAITYMASIRSTFPQIINYAAMAAILFHVERLRAGHEGVAALALAAIVMVGNHQPTALIFALWVLVFLAARIAQAGISRAAFGHLLAATAVAAVGVTFFIVPFALERKFTAENFSTDRLFALERKFTAENFSSDRLLTLALPDPRLFLDAVTWGGYGLGRFYTTYMGYTLLGAAALGGVIGWRQRSPLLGVWLAAALVCGLSLFGYQIYVRQTIFTVLFAAVMAGVGIEMLAARGRAAWLPVVMLALFVLESGPLAVQPWMRVDMRPLAAAGEALAVRAPATRVLEVATGADGRATVPVGPNSSPLQAARVQALRGPHKPDATMAANGFAAALKLAEDDLRRAGTLTMPTRSLLASLNIGWIVGGDGVVPGLPAAWPGLTDDAALGQLGRIAEATPVLASGALEEVARPAAFDGNPLWDDDFAAGAARAVAAKQAVAALHRRMGVDGARAARFLVTSATSPSATSGPAPVVSVQRYQVEPGTIRLTLSADRPGFVRLAHPQSPFARVTLNGVAVTPMADVFTLMVLPIAAGQSVIAVDYLPSTLRILSFWTTAVVIGLLLAVVLWPAARRLRERRAGAI